MTRTRSEAIGDCCCSASMNATWLLVAACSVDFDWCPNLRNIRIAALVNLPKFFRNLQSFQAATTTSKGVTTCSTCRNCVPDLQRSLSVICDRLSFLMPIEATAQQQGPKWQYCRLASLLTEASP